LEALTSVFTRRVSSVSTCRVLAQTWFLSCIYITDTGRD